MTLVVNKSDTNTTFIATCNEVNAVTSGSTMEVLNKYTNVKTVFELPDDTSQYPDRYNLFELSTSTFSGLTIGTYTFKIFDSNGDTTETGLLKVIEGVYTPSEEVDNNYVYIQPTESDDDYLVYGE